MIYVNDQYDNGNIFGYRITADTQNELQSMAALITARKRQEESGYFDISPRQRKLAIALGAKVVSNIELEKVINALITGKEKF